MYTLPSPPRLPYTTHNATRTWRIFAALNTRRSTSTIVTPITEPASASIDQHLIIPISPKVSKLDPTLISTWPHRAWVAAGSASVLGALVNSVVASINSGAVIEPIIAALLGYVLADLGTGFYHFAIDNYGNPSTPIFGAQIEAFQGHHRRPATITRRQPANNLHALARAVAFFVVPVELAVGGGGSNDVAVAAAHAFIGVCAGCIMLSQQFHAWAHGGVPKWVGVLQSAGVLISRDMHGAHHRMPYNNNYCIVSGLWNGVLDEYKVFEMVEMVVFFKFGIRPRSWGETSIEWKEEEEEEEEDNSVKINVTRGI